MLSWLWRGFICETFLFLNLENSKQYCYTYIFDGSSGGQIDAIVAQDAVSNDDSDAAGGVSVDRL